MSNFIQLIWQANAGNTPKKIQASFMKFTSQQIKFDFVANHLLVLDKFGIIAKDRTISA